MEFITDIKSRQRTFNHRKKNLMKKAHELSTLCGIDTCLIIQDSNNTLQLSSPETWPENSHKFNHIIQRYLNKHREFSNKASVKQKSDEKDFEQILCKLESRIEDVNRRIEYLKLQDLVEETESETLIETKNNRSVKWMNPPQNWIKINYGGAIYNEVTSSVCIARNHTGSAIGCWTSLLPKTSQQMMESNALCLAIHTAKENNYEKVIFESDSEWIVKEISDSNSSAIQSIEEAKVYLKQHEFWEVKYADWSTNEAVFELAHWALDFGYHGVLQPYQIPLEVSSVIARENASHRRV